MKLDKCAIKNLEMLHWAFDKDSLGRTWALSDILVLRAGKGQIKMTNHQHP